MRIIVMINLFILFFQFNLRGQVFSYDANLEKHVLIREDGSLEPTRVFDKVRLDLNGSWLVKRDGKWGVMRSNGEIIIPIEYDTITCYLDENFIVESGGKKTLLDFKYLKSKERNLRYCGSYEYEPSNEELIDLNSIWRFVDSENKYLNLFLTNLKQKNNSPVEGNLIVEFLINQKGVLVKGSVLEGTEKGFKGKNIEILNLILRTLLIGKSDGTRIKSRLVFSVDYTIK